jgi:hypothetical protein
MGMERGKVPSSIFQASRPRPVPSSSISRVKRDVFDEELSVVLQALLVERVQDGVTSSAGCCASALGISFPYSRV